MNSRFNLETPSGTMLETVSRFSGWYIPIHGLRPNLRIKREGRSEATLEWGSIRPDVSTVHAHPHAIVSGFQGDFLCDEEDVGKQIDLAIVDEVRPETDLWRGTYAVGTYQPPVLRPRSFNVVELLVCPRCHSRLEKRRHHLICSQCTMPVPLRSGVPHFVHDGGTPCVHLTEPTATNPYSAEVLQILEQYKDGLVLDFGAGHTREDLLRGHVLYLDAVQYRWTDVVCTKPQLPFADHSFDAIVSQAVFEHLSDPHQTAKELHRVLRPGGIVHLDTAFMQPLHGDPWHYFNMTQHGLRKVMAPFEEIRSGIKSYQFPSASLLMQFEAIIPFLSSRRWRKTIEKWHAELQQGAGEFDQALGEIGRSTLAAGFYFEGRRLR